MRSLMLMRVARIVAMLLIVAGVVGLLFVVYLDLYGGRAAVLCGNPADPICSGQYVYGFPNEVWPVLAIVVGTVIAFATRTRQSAAGRP